MGNRVVVELLQIIKIAQGLDGFCLDLAGFFVTIPVNNGKIGAVVAFANLEVHRHGAKDNVQNFAAKPLAKPLSIVYTELAR
jgi:hypothetical protein